MRSKFLLALVGLCISTLGFGGPLMIGVRVKNDSNIGLKLQSYSPQGCFVGAPAQFLQRSGYQDNTKYGVYYAPGKCPHTPAQVTYQTTDGSKSITISVNTVDPSGNPNCWFNLAKSGFPNSWGKADKYMYACAMEFHIAQ